MGTTELKYLMFTTNMFWHNEGKDYILLDHPHVLVGKWVENFTDMALDFASLTQILS